VLSSLQIFTQQNLSELFGTWTFLSLELLKHAKASSQGQTLMPAEASQEKKFQTLLKKSDFKLK